MPREPVKRPVSSLSRVTTPAATTEKTAAERLAVWGSVGAALMAVGLMEVMVQVRETLRAAAFAGAGADPPPPLYIQRFVDRVRVARPYIRICIDFHVLTIHA